MTSTAPPLPPCPARFAARKAAILAQLARPDDEYADASPKGAVDAGIRPLLDVINGLDGFVTTSSCAGRVAVFLEGRRGGGGGGTTDGETVEHVVRDDDGNGAATTVAAVSTAAAVAPPTRASSSGGKGGGGTWLFVSHDPLVPETDGRGGSSSSSTADRYHSTDWASVFGLSMAEGDGVDNDAGVESQEERLVHFKFEPMILHVLTASLAHAQLLLRCAAAAGFRESGAVGIVPGTAAGAGPDSRAEGLAPTPIVAVRSMGLGLASVVGVADASSGDNDDDDQTTAKARCIVSRGYLARLARLADQRFATNRARTERFRAALMAAVGRGQGGPADDSTAAAAAATKPSTWEDADARRARKRAEGLRRQAALKEASAATTGERQESEASL